MSSMDVESRTGSKTCRQMHRLLNWLPALIHIAARLIVFGGSRHQWPNRKGFLRPARFAVYVIGYWTAAKTALKLAHGIT